MRPKIVAGNWKMNKTLAEAKELAAAICSLVHDDDGVTKVMIPPFPFLMEVQQIINGKKHCFSGAQNCHTQGYGAYTGEVSAEMLKSVGCSYVLVGHSERRQYFHENAVQLQQKLKQALSHGLKPIFCVGETLSERNSGAHFTVIRQQLVHVLQSIDKSEMQNVILAYEPVWAIGTGETATSAQAQEVHAYTRSVLKEVFNEAVANATPVLYGGSCNPQNAAELFACPDVDGGLIGGASLKADDFCKIVASF